MDIPPSRPYTYAQIVAAVRGKQVTRKMIDTVREMQIYPDFAKQGYATRTVVNAVAGANPNADMKEMNDFLHDLLTTSEKIETDDHQQKTPV